MSIERRDTINGYWQRLNDKQKKYVKILTSITGVAVVLLFISVSSMNSEIDSISKVQPQEPVAAQAPAQQAGTVQEQTKTLSIIDQLWQSVDTTLKSRSDISVSYDETTKTATVNHTDLEPYNESSFVRQAYTILVVYGKSAFAIEGVEHLNVQNSCNLQDRYGKDTVQSCMTIQMKKSVFNKFDWSQLEYQPVSDTIENESDIYTIAPALSSKVEPSKLYLDLSY